ncbi:hypothetical protein DYU11_31100 [Fibrisoma montanum]|uniref:Carrier domain-containing protein n=1 Tax=Fibrisoma montanum TaxID=2305895 RepID=A0A418LWW1_9BACT|nr:phosphopantetheine-binding protein [Fibrisoma montanum]RIV17693.1 hypothetical protein DYU11_31100 [Fibrisoma montanum]
MDTIYLDIIDLMQTQGVDPAIITPETHFSRDIGYDSLDMTELLILLERRFNLAIPDREYDQLRTVGDVAHYLAKRLESSAAHQPLTYLLL